MNEFSWTDHPILLTSLALFACVVIHFAGFCLGRSEVKEFKSEAIKHGHAYYHPETGNFTWKETGK